MITFLFWNIAKKVDTFASISSLAKISPIDVFFLAECPQDSQMIIAGLNQLNRGHYRDAGGDLVNVKTISRLPRNDFFPHFNNQHGDMTIWNLATDALGTRQLQVAVVHLISKAGGTEPGDHQAVATVISREIAEYEDREGCEDTILVGDLNMNPFDPGMVNVSALHATMSSQIAGRPDRTWRKSAYRRFYNPMWGFFGDRTPGPSGTYYWDKSVTSNQYWYMLDQLLLRPSLVNLLSEIEIVDHDGSRSLLDDDGVPTKDHLSDHLPIRFVLAV